MAEEKSLIEYPSLFPIKVMGKATPEYLPAIVHIAKQFDPIFDESKVAKTFQGWKLSWDYVAN
jgi:putative lipoic acid-binding regulatory protein